MTENRSIKVTEELLQDLQCPVCLKIPQTTPIYQCGKGHLQCKDCHPRLDNCPVCRSSINDTRALIAEKIIARLPADCFLEESQNLKKEKRIRRMKARLSKWLSKFRMGSNQDRSETQSLSEPLYVNLQEIQNLYEVQIQSEDPILSDIQRLFEDQSQFEDDSQSEIQIQSGADSLSEDQSSSSDQNLSEDQSITEFLSRLESDITTALRRYGGLEKEIEIDRNVRQCFR